MGEASANMAQQKEFRELAMLIARAFHNTIDCIVLDCLLTLQLVNEEELAAQLKLPRKIVCMSLYTLQREKLLSCMEHDEMNDGKDGQMHRTKRTEWFADWKQMFDTVQYRIYRMELKCSEAPKRLATGYQCETCQTSFEEIDAPQLFQPDGSMKCNICAGPVSEKLANLTDITASGLSKEQLREELHLLIDHVNKMQKADLIAPLTSYAQRQADKREEAEAAGGEGGVSRQGILHSDVPPGAGYERDPFNPQQWRRKLRPVDGTEKVEVEFVTPKVQQSGRDQEGKYHGVPLWLRDESSEEDVDDDDDEHVQVEASLNDGVLRAAKSWYKNNNSTSAMEIDK